MFFTWFSTVALSAYRLLALHFNRLSSISALFGCAHIYHKCMGSFVRLSTAPANKKYRFRLLACRLLSALRVHKRVCAEALVIRESGWRGFDDGQVRAIFSNFGRGLLSSDRAMMAWILARWANVRVVQRTMMVVVGKGASHGRGGESPS